MSPAQKLYVREKNSGVQRKPEVEYSEFVETSGDFDNVVPTHWNLVEDYEEAKDGSGDVEKHLNNVSPDDGGHPAFERVDQRKTDNQKNGRDLAGTENNGYDNGNSEDTDTFG